MAFKKPYKTYLIESKAIIETDERGKRFPRGEVKYGRFVRWQKYDSPKANFKDAVRQATKSAMQKDVGYTIYRRVVLNELLTDDIKPLYKVKKRAGQPIYTEYTSLGKRWLKL